jgi:glycosyltransferase involved in cell wall biosynthesis
MLRAPLAVRRDTGRTTRSNPVDNHLPPSQMHSTSPLVSVVLATFNTAQFLRAAVLSALQQTYENIELIVVDDGSTDSTSAILDELALDQRLRPARISNKRSLWNPQCRNRHVRESYVAFLEPMTVASASWRDRSYLNRKRGRRVFGL